MKIIYITIIFSLIISCKNEETIDYGLANTKDCKTFSPFINKLGMSPSTTAFSTSEKNTTGICLIDITDVSKKYQDSTWKDKGNFGPMAIDEQGNVYVVPVPFVNVLESIRKNQNIVYKLDGQTGKLNQLMELSNKLEINSENPYGAVGLFYDCATSKLYVSNIAGSTRKEINGKIFCIDVSQSPAKIIDEYANTDAMGVGVTTFNDKKYLFYGDTRNHNIYRIELTEEGKFKGDKIFCFSLLNIGSRGDDICKKIRFSTDNTILVTGTQFNYNLTAPSQKQETIFKFNYDVNESVWKQVQ